MRCMECQLWLGFTCRDEQLLLFWSDSCYQMRTTLSLSFVRAFIESNYIIHIRAWKVSNRWFWSCLLNYLTVGENRNLNGAAGYSVSKYINLYGMTKKCIKRVFACLVSYVSQCAIYWCLCLSGTKESIILVC